MVINAISNRASGRSLAANSKYTGNAALFSHSTLTTKFSVNKSSLYLHPAPANALSKCWIGNEVCYLFL